MTGLAVADFPAYFRAVHGRTPFPWQIRLLRTVIEDGWPTLCDLPPASGKTAAIDVSVFALALDALSEPRRMPMRTVFTVDRRLVVDEAHARALLIAGKLRDVLGNPEPDGPDEWVLAEVARRLAALGGAEEGRPPLQVAVLRGGLPRDNGWVESVRQPTVVLSTVDQVGSRVLFRGYGVSPRMAPVHAGLLGEDCLHLVDEAHLSLPFAETMSAVRMLRQQASDPLDLPFAVVTMTATPEAKATGHVFQLDMRRDGPDRADTSVLDRRFAAMKRTRMGTAPPRDIEKQARALVDYAKECLRDARVRVVGVVVNRVRLARKIHDLLAKQFGEIGDDPTTGGSLLLTGRCRPFERDMLLGIGEDRLASAPFARIIDRIRTGRDRGGQTLHRPLFVVGTQSIEAGADLDFDALVTEIAPWPSLRQRFGRLDRAGELGTTAAWVVRTHDPAAKDPGAADRVYGDAGWNTCRWLWTLCGGDPTSKTAPEESIDLGVDGQVGLGGVPPGLSPEFRHAPCLTPAVLDLFAQTSPRPYPDPDPALWLHGPTGGPAEVQVVWRADAPDTEDEATWRDFTDVLALVPPTSSEALPLPVWAARAWLSNLPADGTDIEAADISRASKNAEPKVTAARKVFIWRGAEHSELVMPHDVRPGDTVVLPASQGGCDRFGWVPEPGDDLAPVRDLAREAIARARERTVVRVHPALLNQADWQRAQSVLSGLSDEENNAAVFAGLAAALPTLMVGLGPHPDCARYGSDITKGFALVGRPRRRSERQIRVRPDLLDDDDRAMLALGRVLLTTHCEGVGREIETACRAVGMRERLREDATLAGVTHDIGKAEPRFKAMLWNTDFIAALPRPPLAKSIAAAASRNGWASTLGRVSLPAGARHECWSVAMLDGSALLATAHDPNLVLWLVGTHHGHGRPCFDPVEDPQPAITEIVLDVTHREQTVRLRGPVRHDLTEAASGWSDRFDVMLARYGHWGLAWLEALVRLSDARRSRLEAERLAHEAEGQGLFASARTA